MPDRCIPSTTAPGRDGVLKSEGVVFSVATRTVSAGQGSVTVLESLSEIVPLKLANSLLNAASLSDGPARLIADNSKIYPLRTQNVSIKKKLMLSIL